jgi:hypothetical protein
MTQLKETEGNKLIAEFKLYGLTFDQWLYVLKHVLIADYGFTAEASAGYVGDGSDWKDYYEEDYSPADAAAEDASYG